MKAVKVLRITLAIAAVGTSVCVCSRIALEEASLQNKDVIGAHDLFLTLETPHIRSVVKQASAEEPDFYLSHAPDGAFSFLGTPYIASETSRSNKHLVIFGHHMFPTTFAFSKLADAYRPHMWNTVGNLTLSDSSGHIDTYQPFCASCVMKDFELIQGFDFSNEDTFNKWLSQLAGKADVVRSELVGKQWTQAVTLCTCSDARAGNPKRTIVTFVR